MTEITSIDSLTLLPTKRLKQTTCPYCGVGCGVDVQLDASTQSDSPLLTSLQGTIEHPANFGRLCVKGQNLLETNVESGRLLAPEVDGKKCTWSAAINRVAGNFKQIIERHGPDSVAFYVSGQLLTEDYYVANKLMKGYIGSANIDTNSRLCMSSAVAAYKRAFGADAVPCCYEDLEQADLLVLVGSNAAWTHPVLFQRIEKAKLTNPDVKIVIIDPRRTASCEIADLHLPIKAGSDVALFNGLLNFLIEQGAVDSEFIDNHTSGLQKAADMAEGWTLNAVAQYCDIKLSDLKRFYRLFADKERTMTLYSMGVNQSASGVDKANGIINCHLVTAKIGKVGCGPFSLTGQPNAMGGREVGGLSNMLAAHMDIENPEHQMLVKEYWNSPTIATKQGSKAVDLFDQVLSGKIKAVWIMATNPVVSMPNRNKIEAALKKCELVVVSDYVAENDTMAFADVRLPATGWLEKNGTVTNSERRISRQRGIMPPAGEAKHDWQIICDVAKAMGYENGFNFKHPAQIFDEHAGLTSYKNDGSRALDLSGLHQISERQYNQLRPVQWPIKIRDGQGTKRLFTDNRYFTESGRANFVPLEVKLPAQQVSDAFPYVLNSGRVRDQWHTMTRTGSTAKLIDHTDKPFVALHPDDARAKNVKEGNLIKLLSASQKSGSADIVLPVKIDSSQRKGELFAPIHWSQTWSSSASIARLYSDANDPISGQPELKHGAVDFRKVEFSGYGKLFSTVSLPQDTLSEQFEFWVKTPLRSGVMYTFAGYAQTIKTTEWLNSFDCVKTQWMSVVSEDYSRHVASAEGKLRFALFLAKANVEIEKSWIESLLSEQEIEQSAISSLLRVQPDERFLQGRTICSCFNVGEKTIVNAITRGCTSVDMLGKQLKCGTNCGSCKSELSQLINQHGSAGPNDHQIIALEAV